MDITNTTDHPIEALIQNQTYTIEAGETLYVMDNARGRRICRVFDRAGATYTVAYPLPAQQTPETDPAETANPEE